MARHTALLALLVAASGAALSTALLVPAASRPAASSLPPAVTSQSAVPPILAAVASPELPAESSVKVGDVSEAAEVHAGLRRGVNSETGVKSDGIKIETSVKSESDAQGVKELPPAASSSHSEVPPMLAAVASPELPAKTSSNVGDVNDAGEADAGLDTGVRSETSLKSDGINIETSVESESDAQGVKELPPAPSSHASQQIQGFAIEQKLKAVDHAIAEKPPLAPSAGMTAKTLPASSTPPKAAAQKTAGLASQATLKVQRTNLQNLLGKMKADISRFNKDEAEDQNHTASHVEVVRKRLEQDKARLASPKLRPFMRQLLQNRTKEEQRDLDFWSHSRSLQKRMFHSNIKMTHGLMSRVKGVLQVFDQALDSGTISEEAAQRLKSAVNGLQ